ncbi:MAG: outer membrane protein assembly factor BamE [Gammaproteobacteria bacterium]|nr:outer membrane protein assembly factor BamE [Gammaproteobacteria bacterium]
MPRVARRLLQRLCAALFVAAAASAAGCKGWSPDHIPGVTPYRIEIQQGNFVSQDMLSKLKRGMSREQVRFVLGTPLINDMFHADRWDYVFYREFPDRTREERRVSVFFENDRLVRVEGDVVPEGAASKAQAPAPAGARTAETER